MSLPHLPYLPLPFATEDMESLRLGLEAVDPQRAAGAAGAALRDAEKIALLPTAPLGGRGRFMQKKEKQDLVVFATLVGVLFF